MPKFGNSTKCVIELCHYQRTRAIPMIPSSFLFQPPPPPPLFFSVIFNPSPYLPPRSPTSPQTPFSSPKKVGLIHMKVYPRADPQSIPESERGERLISWRVKIQPHTSPSAHFPQPTTQNVRRETDLKIHECRKKRSEIRAMGNANFRLCDL